MMNKHLIPVSNTVTAISNNKKNYLRNTTSSILVSKYCSNNTKLAIMITKIRENVLVTVTKQYFLHYNKQNNNGLNQK